MSLQKLGTTALSKLHEEPSNKRGYSCQNYSSPQKINRNSLPSWCFLVCFLCGSKGLQMLNFLGWNWPVIVSEITMEELSVSDTFLTTSSVSFMGVTSYVSGEQSRHVSGKANRRYFKHIVLMKQSCCSMYHQSPFLSPDFCTSIPQKRRCPSLPTEKKMSIASTTFSI